MTPCPLCQHDHITEHLYEDECCWIARCASHLDQWMIVLARHTTTLSDLEKDHITSVLEEYFDDKYQLRNEATILDHWHKHIVELD